MSRLWMICYDISEHRTRRRVEKYLLDYTRRIQESVFEGYLSLEEKVSLEMDAATDSIRFYPLCAWCTQSVAWHGLGTQTQESFYYTA